MNKKDKLEILNMIYAIVDYPDIDSNPSELSQFQKDMLNQIDNISDDVQKDKA